MFTIMKTTKSDTGKTYKPVRKYYDYGTESEKPEGIQAKPETTTAGRFDKRFLSEDDLDKILAVI